RLEEISETHFSATNFAVLQTDLSPESLQRISRIAGVTQHAQNVRKLHLVPRWGEMLGTGFSWECSGHDHVTNRRNDAETLHRLLANHLINCRSFFVYHDEDVVDSYQPRGSTENHGLGTGDAISLLFSIIIEADLEVKSWSISAFNNERHYACPARIDTTTLPLGLIDDPRFKIVWATIHELTLGYVIAGDQHDWVIGLVSSAPNLKVLSLGFDDRTSGCLERLASAPSIPSLESLKITSAMLSAQLISDLLDRLQNSLICLRLENTFTEENSSWASTLAFLAKKTLRLRKISILTLIDPSRGGLFTHFPALRELPRSNQIVTRKGDDFRQLDTSNNAVIRLKNGGLEWTPEHLVKGVSYEGPEMSRVLDKLADAIEIYGPVSNRLEQ
ncbi:MAG: hypothetical protein Q9169_008676, partial [Polycauliona sp. 2 TL-2023]